MLVADGQPAVPGATIIAEYIDETLPADDAGDRLLPAAAGDRVEVRRLASWFNDKFHAEVSGPLVNERVFKRHMTAEQGGGPPDTEAMRAARHNIRYHLAYIGWLVRTRDWLAGDRLSLADLAAAAHLSAADYLGDVPWNEDEAAKNWYARVKSRPSFRTLLADTLAGLPPVEELRRSRLLTDPDKIKAALIEHARARGFDVAGVTRPDAVPRSQSAAGAFSRRRRAWRHGVDGDAPPSAAPSPSALWPRRALGDHARHELRAGRGSAGDPERARTARAISIYAKGDDYHELIKARLKARRALAGRRMPAAT